MTTTSPSLTRKQRWDAFRTITMNLTPESNIYKAFETAGVNDMSKFSNLDDDKINALKYPQAPGDLTQKDLTGDERREVRAALCFYLNQTEKNCFEMPPLDMMTNELFEKYYEGMYRHGDNIPNMTALQRTSLFHPPKAGAFGH